jgi:hypothetical protein
LAIAESLPLVCRRARRAEASEVRESKPKIR